MVTLHALPSHHFHSSLCFCFSPALRISQPHILRQRSRGGRMLIYDLNRISQYTVSGGLWSHGIAISPGRQYGFGQVQAAAGSLIRVSVMSPHLSCWRCHVLKAGSLIVRPCPWGRPTSIQDKGLVFCAVVEIWSISTALFGLLTKFHGK